MRNEKYTKKQRIVNVYITLGSFKMAKEPVQKNKRRIGTKTSIKFIGCIIKK